MSCTHYQPLLSAYLDDVLSDEDRTVIEMHLRGCGDCRTVAGDLQVIRSAAASLEPLIPPARVWHQIAAATAAQPRGGWLPLGWFGWRSLSAAVMTAVIATSLWRVGTLLGPVAGESARPAVVTTRLAADAEADFADAIARLERVSTSSRDMLDEETAGALSAGLVVIDKAIFESRAALQDEPQNESAQESLFVALRRKVAVLQEMIALSNEMRRVSETQP